LLCAIHVHGSLYWFSLLALVPFLWRVVRVAFAESVLVGVLLGGSLFVVATPINSAGLLDTSLRALALAGLFALYAATVNRLARCCGRNVIFLALPWLPLEYAWRTWVGHGSFLAFSQMDSFFVLRIGSIFGILMVSFFVIVINVAVLGLIDCTMRMLEHTAVIISAEGALEHRLNDAVRSLTRRVYLLPLGRAPPSHSSP
jgi:apolipoprotein N-acyltransferase